MKWKWDASKSCDRAEDANPYPFTSVIRGPPAVGSSKTMSYHPYVLCSYRRRGSRCWSFGCSLATSSPGEEPSLPWVNRTGTPCERDRSLERPRGLPDLSDMISASRREPSRPTRAVAGRARFEIHFPTRTAQRHAGVMGKSTGHAAIRGP